MLAADRLAVQGGRTTASSSARHASISAFHQVESFLLSLTDARDDGRVIFTVETSQHGKAGVLLKYILLNPAERFREVVESARSVILAGGTMEPARFIPIYSATDVSGMASR